MGTAPALELLLDIGTEAIHRHNLRLANLFRDGLGLKHGDSAIVSTEDEVSRVLDLLSPVAGRRSRP